MTYLITTKPPVQHVGPMGAVGRTWSRHAVATLEELDRQIRAEYAVSLHLPEQGGTVGPLPDGTVIEVAHASWDDLVGPDGWNAYSTDESVADDFNSKEGGGA